MRYLRRNTSNTVAMGQFVNPSDGYNFYTTTPAPFTVYTKKAGGTWNPKADATATNYTRGGWFDVVLGAGDCDTAGRLKASVDATVNYLGVWDDFFVLPEAVYDSLVADNTGLAKTNTVMLDTAGTATIATRLTAARALNLDNLNVGGLVASSAQLSSLDTATPLARLTVTPAFVKPATGSIVYPLILEVRNLGGILTDPDGGTINLLAVTNGAGVDRSANLATWTRLSAGIYENGYSVAAAAADEGLILRFGGAVGGNAWSTVATPAVLDAESYGTSDRTMLTALFNVAPAHVPLIDANGFMSANNLPADYQQRGVAVTLPAAPAGYGGASGGDVMNSIVTDTNKTLRQCIILLISNAAGPFGQGIQNPVNAAYLDYQRHNPFTNMVAYTETVNPTTKTRVGFEAVDLDT